MIVRVPNLAFVDIDGVIANNSTRVLDCTTDYGSDGLPILDWSMFFNPDRVAQDTLISGTLELLEILQGKGYEIILLTSRPIDLELVTRVWLDHYNIPLYPLLMKPISAQYLKTPVWKTSTIDSIASLLCASQVVVVDDSLKVMQALIHSGIRSKFRLYTFEGLPGVEGLPDREG